MELVFTLQEIEKTARDFWEIAGLTRVFAFHGEMGVGKTTFIHALCDAKKVTSTVGSPTFSIINEYVFTENGQHRKIYHIDLYRLKDEAEAIQAGVEDCLYSDHICLVEWPERAEGIFPAGTRAIYLEMIDSGTRRLRIGEN